MINIFYKQELQSVLLKLEPGAQPLWGKMSPQHVVEHLTKTVKASVGKIPVKLYLEPEAAEVLKQKLIYGDMQLSPGIKSPVMGDEPPALVYPDLSSAMQELYAEMDHFRLYYAQNSEAMHTHPRMGDLKHAEWKVFHSKHFAPLQTIRAVVTS